MAGLGKLESRIAKLLAALERENADAEARGRVVLQLPRNGRDIDGVGRGPWAAAELQLIDGDRYEAHRKAGLSHEESMQRAWEDSSSRR